MLLSSPPCTPHSTPPLSDLAAVGVIDPLLDLLEKGTDAGRKGAARALGRMAEDPAVAEKLYAPGKPYRRLGSNSYCRHT